MKKRTTLLWLLGLALTSGVFAQQSESKKINSIKRDNQYIYAEATMGTEEEAYQVAEELLIVYINEYVESKKKLNKAENVIIKDLTSNCEKIQMMRGEVYRVFLYVKKSSIIPAENAITLVKPEKADSENLDGNPFDSGEELASDTGDETLKLDVAWQQAVVDELLTLLSLTEARALLNRLRAEYKIKRYGNYNECKNPADCFWLISDVNGSIQTVLGPGTSLRTNFRTMQYDSLQNYSGSNAIWFTFSK